jgi:hypothetical protein
MASLSWRQQLAHCARLGNALCCWRQDKLATVRKFGRPDYFVTVTRGPSWPEFAAELLPGQAVNDRSDRVARCHFPMQLCFALTINKAQGQMLQHMGVRSLLLAHVWRLQAPAWP